jgi:hypothetical protein
MLLLAGETVSEEKDAKQIIAQRFFNFSLHLP